MSGVRTRLRNRWYTLPFWPWWHDRVLRRMGLKALIWRTGNFTQTTWLGRPLLQNPLDAWALQEALVSDGVDLVIECGTHRGGSAYYMATLFDLLGRGHIISIDVAPMVDFEHERIDFVKGSSVDPAIVAKVMARADELDAKNILVLLDSDHSESHVLRELTLYSELVPVGGYVYVQDGCIDELRFMRADRPGPLRAIEQFVEQDPRFVVDDDRSKHYVFSHSPSGWLRRTS